MESRIVLVIRPLSTAMSKNSDTMSSSIITPMG